MSSVRGQSTPHINAVLNRAQSFVVKKNASQSVADLNTKFFKILDPFFSGIKSGNIKIDDIENKFTTLLSAFTSAEEAKAFDNLNVRENDLKNKKANLEQKLEEFKNAKMECELLAAIKSSDHEADIDKINEEYDELHAKATKQLQIIENELKVVNSERQQKQNGLNKQKKALLIYLSKNTPIEEIAASNNKLLSSDGTKAANKLSAMILNEINNHIRTEYFSLKDDKNSKTKLALAKNIEKLSKYLTTEDRRNLLPLIQPCKIYKRKFAGEKLLQTLHRTNSSPTLINSHKAAQALIQDHILKAKNMTAELATQSENSDPATVKKQIR